MPEYMFPPALLFLVASFIVPILKGRIRDVFILLVPLVGLAQLVMLTDGSFWSYKFMDRYDLVLLEVSTLRLCFAYVFVIICFVASLYALHIKQAAQHTAAFAYVGSSLGVVFAGDYFTLFVYWELMAVTSTVIILCRGNRASREAAYRYFLVHVAGGACLMAGIVLQLNETGSIALVTPEAGLPFWFVLVGFCLNAAVPPLSAWLSDAYPEGSVTGSVYLTAYTTKTAVFTLALLFSGTPVLMWAGAVMSLYGVLFACMENDIRRLLSYHIISQVGYMVCGIGIGSELAINGSAAHAFSHILYKALLFMGTGAVIQATGRRQMTELGGIARAMPIVFVCYMVAGFSISGVPLWNGFISKSLIISAASAAHQPIIELMLVLASVGTFFSTTLKLPYYTFLGKDRGLKVDPLPKNMLVAMCIGAFLCTLFGVYPDLLYRLLPNNIEYHPYTRDHVVSSLQLLLACGLAFVIFIKYFCGHHAFTRDTELIYRGAGKLVQAFSSGPLEAYGEKKRGMIMSIVNRVTELARHPERLVEIPVLCPLLTYVERNNLKESIGMGVVLSIVAMSIILIFLFSL
jgi:multicomponent Na+:H+ antiporter subunit D